MSILFYRNNPAMLERYIQDNRIVGVTVWPLDYPDRGWVTVGAGEADGTSGFPDRDRPFDTKREAVAVAREMARISGLPYIPSPLSAWWS